MLDSTQGGEITVLRNVISIPRANAGGLIEAGDEGSPTSGERPPHPQPCSLNKKPCGGSCSVQPMQDGGTHNIQQDTGVLLVAEGSGSTNVKFVK